MITDGKPSCLSLKDGTYYKNSVGLDPKIVNKCYVMAKIAHRLKVPITTFMILFWLYYENNSIEKIGNSIVLMNVIHAIEPDETF